MKLILWAALLSLTTANAATLYQHPSADYSVIHSQVPPLPTSSSDIVRYDDDMVMEVCISDILEMQRTLDWIEVRVLTVWEALDIALQKKKRKRKMKD